MRPGARCDPARATSAPGAAARYGRRAHAVQGGGAGYAACIVPVAITGPVG
ncbi:hypothetical protein BLA18109_05800 [Burkholderia lata]|uniref:Uncharacterized protein n=1 Tax=Burkholderia lata (strain ATCC 17760 / DSM 23089 / LMG 22485 / NCIMB 9086 / R18194 / 383) TaxID=482957 RepID=A0A6P2YGF2_BURL3|nr:hypothetical protein BLA18109_05800 [Burkholderia lata]